jgi:uncharacterized protein (DUF1330 family)
MTPDDLIQAPDGGVGDEDFAATIRGCVCMWINDVDLGRMDDYLHAVEHEVLPLYRKHGVDLIGAWRGSFGLPRNQVILLIDYHSLERYEALYSDPAYYEMDQRVGFSKMRKNTAWMLRPLRFSPR